MSVFDGNDYQHFNQRFVPNVWMGLQECTCARAEIEASTGQQKRLRKRAAQVGGSKVLASEECPQRVCTAVTLFAAIPEQHN
jgi:hypothetical protein